MERECVQIMVVEAVVEENGDWDREGEISGASGL